MNKGNEAVRAAVESVDMKQQFAAKGLELEASNPSQFAEFIASEQANWAAVTKAAKVKIE